MRLSRFVIQRVAPLLNIPSHAMRMIAALADLSGFDRHTVPRELIPLNATQISRGLLNYAVFQGLHDWVFPYAFEQQLNPGSPSFVPRAHLSVMMNVTHRNWTGIGNPDADTEPIVDPRGLVTFGPNGWSIDFWLQCGRALIFPSQHERVTQRLVENDPVVETVVEGEHVVMRTTAYTIGTALYCKVDVERDPASPDTAAVIVAVRPFNPEGASLVHTLQYEPQNRTLRINKTHSIRFSDDVSDVAFSTFEEGDVARRILAEEVNRNPGTAECPIGLATGAMRFALEPGTSRKSFLVRWSDGGDPTAQIPFPEPSESHSAWSSYRDGVMRLRTPDAPLNALFTSSLSTLILLLDGNTITPGPFTYHQFWFRDAAAMLSALDKAGCARRVDPVVRSFPQHQERSGFFRSQQGEWDSNRQALWLAWHHALYASDSQAMVGDLFGSLRRGARWIEKTRQRSNERTQGPAFGLLPPGLSAEHLGLVDYYYWDDFWSLAGIYAYRELCLQTEHREDARGAGLLAREFMMDIHSSLEEAERRLHSRAIPAGPFRGYDSGMVGSIVAAYPLQILCADDDRIGATLDTVQRRFFRDGMFFQDFIHSGWNTYLTLQTAHTLLYRGEGEEAYRLFRAVADRATPTGALPEAINPKTGGGVMGDGHHGWAAAEVVLYLRDMFVYEKWSAGYERCTLVLLSGIPEAWCREGNRFGADAVPVPGGRISLDVVVGRNDVTVVIEFTGGEDGRAVECELVLAGNRHTFELKSGRHSFVVQRNKLA